MDGLKIYQELEAEYQSASNSRKFMAQAGKEKAKAESEYRKAKAEAILKARLDGQPATLIKDSIFQDRELCKLLYLRDAAVTVYESAKEEVLLHKKRIDILRDQMQEVNRGS